MEPGAHIGAAANKLAHNRIDFVVPLLQVWLSSSSITQIALVVLFITIFSQMTF
jgi:hypothetical protein